MKILTKHQIDWLREVFDVSSTLYWPDENTDGYDLYVTDSLDSHEALRRLLKFAWWLVTDEGREQVDADTRQTILDAIGDESWALVEKCRGRE